MEYGSLEQLVAARYLEIMAAPSEVNACYAGLYSIIRRVYEALVKDPGLMFKSLHPEDIYRNRFNMSSENKPELYGLMKRIFGAIEAFFVSFREVLKIAEQAGDVLRVPNSLKLKKSHIKLLEAAGITCTVGKAEYVLTSEMFISAGNAWKQLADDKKISDFMFARGAFGIPEDYVHDVFRRGLGCGDAFDRLIAYLRKNDFQMGIMRGDELVLDYSRDYGKKPSPLKTGWAERDHSGIECKYYPLIEKACAITLRIPGITKLLNSFGDMPENVKAFVVSRNKKCDACGYCIQTDKAGKRPFACIPAEYDDKVYQLCPRFPGFQFTWDCLDDKTVDNMIAYLEFIDKTLGI